MYGTPLSSGIVVLRQVIIIYYCFFHIGLGDGAADGESEVVEQITKLSTLKIFKGI
jgi:hypothetical protein